MRSTQGPSQRNLRGGWMPGVAGDGSRRRFLGPRTRKALLACLALVLAAVIAFGILLVVTPSVGNARQLAQAFDQGHGAVYPGPAVPARFARSLEATEDHRFASEPGVDPVALVRIVYSSITGNGDQGGATLYQQLAKMLYTPGGSSFSDKAEQVALAVKLKYSYSGPEILRLYADVAYFGHGFYGLADASCGYFGVPADQLSWPQAALLAGLVQAPSADDPIANPASGRAREQHVIGRLVAVGAISPASAEAYLKIPVADLTANAGACKG